MSYKPKDSLAVQGETFVANLLGRKGWKILARNYRIKGSEIDLIASKAKTLIFVEVKTRSSIKSFSAIQEIGRLFPRTKSIAIRRGIQHFLNRQDMYRISNIRCDLALVEIRRENQSLVAYFPDVPLYIDQ